MGRRRTRPYCDQRRAGSKRTLDVRPRLLIFVLSDVSIFGSFDSFDLVDDVPRILLWIGIQHVEFSLAGVADSDGDIKWVSL